LCFSSLVFETGSHYVSQAGLEPKTLLFQLLKYFDHRLIPPFPVLYFLNSVTRI
jgi:hypothetical protein